MKIKMVSDVKTIMSNPTGVHNYFGWPTVARLQVNLYGSTGWL